MMNPTRIFLLYLLPLFLPPCVLSHTLAQKPTQKQAMLPVSWVFDIKQDKDENPHGNVYLRVGKKRTLIMKTSSGWRVLARADYKERGIPAAALAACSGWWAGQGDDMYVVRRGKRLDVYWRGLDEQADTLPYKRIKSVPLSW